MVLELLIRDFLHSESFESHTKAGKLLRDGDSSRRDLDKRLEKIALEHLYQARKVRSKGKVRYA
jgi:hypothetical protein